MTKHTPECDFCESAENVTPIYDPWGGHHGYICEVCNDRKVEERAMDQEPKSFRHELMVFEARRRRHFGVR